MLFQVDPSDDRPIYAQIADQVTFAVAAGSLRPGDRVPSVRELSRQLVVNPNTVARAYRELELAGTVTKRRTAGTYVSGAGSRLARRERVRILTERIDGLLTEARQMDIDVDDVVDLLRQREALMGSPTAPASSSTRKG